MTMHQEEPDVVSRIPRDVPKTIQPKLLSNGLFGDEAKIVGHNESHHPTDISMTRRLEESKKTYA
jgi:hypothetical protein